jgi:hypothetical protein
MVRMTAKKIHRIIITTTLLLLGTISIVSAERLTTRIDRLAGDMNDVFIFEVEVEGVTNEPPEMLGGSDFDISYLGVSRMTQIINGSISQSTIFRYQLRPEKTGVLESPYVKNSNQSTTPKNITVSKGKKLSKLDLDSQLSLEHKLSKNEVFVGEQVISEIIIKSNTPNPIINKVEDLSTEGAWQVELPPQSPKCKKLTECTTTLAYALFPLKSGKLVIPGRKMEGAVIVRQNSHSVRDPWLDPFGSSFQDLWHQRQTVPVKLESNEVILDVKPLPGKAVPYVGFIDTMTETPILTVQSGKNSARISIRLISNANLESLKNLPVRDGVGYELFWEEPQKNTQVQDGELLTTLTFTAMVVGTSSGDHLISFEPLEYFDPQTKSYQKANIEPIELHVLGTRNDPSTLLTPTKENVEKSILKVDPEPAMGLSRTSLLLLVTGLVPLAGLLLALCFYFYKVKKRQKLTAKIDNYRTVDQLKEGIRQVAELITNKKIPPSVSLRDYVNSSSFTETERSQLIRIIDLLDEYLYGGHANQELLNDLRVKLLELLK